ncbi:hypothetical protein EW026_g4446 [Hermanssonia centrifuga]|uniref:Haloacid dehalogenase n=1 Tax=Hermanssonia centrifuga TaxID=98765 RepID=A0A4S4KH26_9APHY|nr:hypothetical protein EW026_g4446 [Hermanssonia centrifuga]
MGVQDRRDAMEALKGVEAIFFDVFGTVVDWQGGVSQELNRHYEGLLGIDWIAFAREWRAGYFATTRRIAEGGTGSMNVDVVHREILDSMLASPRWEHLGLLWDEEKRRDLTLAWHRLSGWPDSKEGLYAIKKQAIITTLSNGSVKLLVDMVSNWQLITLCELQEA